MISRRTSRLFSAVLVPAFCVVGMLLGTQSAAAQAAEINLATVWPEENFHTRNAQRFAKEVLRATQGRVRITVKDRGQLGFRGSEHLRSVRDGQIAMADILTVAQTNDEPMLGTESIPFLVGSAEDLRTLHKHLRPVYDEIATKHYQKIIYMVPWPPQYLFLQSKAERLDELSGIRIRAADKNVSEMLAALGMSPVLLPWGDTVPALATRSITGVATSTVSAVDGKFWQYLTAIHPTNHAWFSQMVTINLDVWKRISPEDRAIIEEIGRTLEPSFWEAARAADAEALAQLRAHGMQVVALPAETLTEMRAATAPLREAFLERVPGSAAAVRAYLAEQANAPSSR